MFIDPIQAMNNLSEVNQTQKIRGAVDTPAGAEGTQQGAKIPFKSFFEEAIKDVIDTDRQVNIDAEKLATGQSDNLHEHGINIAKAQLSMDLLVELRNKTLESYNEVMRMSV